MFFLSLYSKQNNTTRMSFASTRFTRSFFLSPVFIHYAGVIPTGDEDEAKRPVEKAHGEVPGRGRARLWRSSQVRRLEKRLIHHKHTFMYVYTQTKKVWEITKKRMNRSCVGELKNIKLLLLETRANLLSCLDLSLTQSDDERKTTVSQWRFYSQLL